MKINLEKWIADRIAVETQIRAQKAQMRAPRHMPDNEEYRALYGLKARATILYKIRAQLRGRQHQYKAVVPKYSWGVNTWVEEPVSREQEAEEIRLWIADYVPAEPVAASVT